MYSKWQATIGLEIHAQLATRTKLFCSCPNDSFTALPNSNICPICLGLPGTLPVLNKQAIEYTVDLGYDVEAKIAQFTKWDRKNYFYPDLPKGYQISQYDLPLLIGGAVEFKDDRGIVKRIDLTRIHLEEDAGKLIHEGNAYTLVDYNRAGVPLLELVTEPLIHSASDAKLFCQTYQFILRRRGIARADMEKGEMRCEANVSVSKPEEGRKAKLGTKVEVKNLNSFRAVERAIEFEIKRQIEILENGEKVISETRGWDEIKQKTFTQRIKETASGYRYFPEPDLPPVTPDSLWNLKNKAKVALSFPHLMMAELKHDYGLPEQNIQAIASDSKVFQLWTELLSELPAPNDQDKAKLAQAIKIFINLDVAQNLDATQLLELADLLIGNIISQSQIREIVSKTMESNLNPKEAVKVLGLEQISDNSVIETVIDKVISQHQDVVKKYQTGETKVLGFLVGQVMKQMRGRANPAIINRILQEKISSD